MLRFFRKDLAAAHPEGAKPPAAGRAPVDRALLRIAGVVFGSVLVLFTLSSLLQISIAAIAVGGGIFMLFSTVSYRGFRVEKILARVDWTILLLFVGLFVVLRAVEDAGLVQGLIAPATSVGSGGGDPTTLGWLAGVTAILSNLISNVPAVLLLAPVVRSLNTNKAWMVLAASSTLSGNATLLGAAANLITAEVARAHGYEFPWLRFTLIGLPVAAATLLISTAAIALLPV